MFCSWLSATLLQAVPNDRSPLDFTEEHPLVYEDAWDLWPYTFLNENGEPVGYNIDLLKLIFNELDIPFVIKLKPTEKALSDLKEGRSDVMCGMDAHFHSKYGKYGKSVIQIFTHSVVHRKGTPVAVRTVGDLERNKVIVHNCSFSHHLMLKRGWGSNAIPYNDMQEAIQLVNNEQDRQILWNTVSLEWLIRKFHFDGLELTPVRIPHGEYKFMSNNTALLHQMDSVYTLLNASGRLQPIQNKWFYPDRHDTGIPSWIWYVIAALVVLLMVCLAYLYSYNRLEHQMTKDVRRRNNRLAQVLSTSHVHIWLYDVAKNTINRFDERGQESGEAIQPERFFASLEPADNERIRNALHAIALQETETHKLEVKQQDSHSQSTQYHTINLSVLRRDKAGRPTHVIGTSGDVTGDQLRQKAVQDSMLRYQAVFNSTMADIVSYDSNGFIVDMNKKARQAFPGGIDHILNAHVSIADVLGMPEVTPDNLEYTYVTQLFNTRDDNRALIRYLSHGEMYYELQLQPVRDADGRLLAAYGTGRNVTDVVQTYRHLQHNTVQLQQATDEVSSYIRNIDFVLQNGGVRVIDYSPDTHLLVVHNRMAGDDLTLTQGRMLSLVTEESKRAVRRALKSMDGHMGFNVTATVKTLLLHHDRQTGARIPLCLYLSLVPVYDADGQLTGYFGMCRDISAIKATEERLAQEAVKAQEVEAVKNAFLRNMSYQIRIPLHSVVGFADLFRQEHERDDEPLFIKEINDNSSLLLKLINDILFLSRLDARMIEFKTAPTDMVGFFDARCQTAWFHIQQPGVSYIVDNVYEHLVVDIDIQNLGIVIDKIVTNAVQHTRSGEVRASYTYTGEDLVMTFQDTGSGIAPDALAHIFDRFATSDGQGAGLGLSISHEIIQQMGGKVTIQSVPGDGTIVWVSVPCRCSEMKRITKKEEQAV